MLADGRVPEAMALQAAATHNVWCASRVTQDPTLSLCSRCGGEPETLLHRFWTCPNNAQCVHPDIAGVQHLISEANAVCSSNAAFWLGCLITGGMLNPMIERVPIQN